MKTENEIPFLYSLSKSYFISDIISLGSYLVEKKRNTGELNRPLTISSDQLSTPLFVAACWKFGIPFWIKPADSKTIVPKVISDTINPSEEYNDVKIDQVLSDKNSSAEFPEEINPNNVFGYFLTSGTSGVPKVVALKRSQMLHAAHASAMNFKPMTTDQWLLCLPIHHIGGCSVILRSLIYGNPIYDARFLNIYQIALMLQSEESLRFASMVPTQLSSILVDNPNFTTHSTFKTILLGGGPSDSSLILKAWKNKIPVVKSYGMSETCAQISTMTLNALELQNPSSSGRVLDGNQMQIRNSDETGIGELWVKGPQVIQSYYFNENKNSAFDGNGWFFTGDFARLDNNHSLFIEMRREDRIVSGGENINPLEVEEVIRATFNVADVAVVGLPDKHWGQIVVAAIAAPNFDSNLFYEKLKVTLPGYKIPKKTFMIDKIPRNEMGKINRKSLSEMLQKL